MAEANGAAPPQQPRRVPPMIALPPQTSFETLFTGGPGPGFSPGPMTLISSFFADHNSDIDCRSFSQLLAGAMASPASQIPPTSLLDDYSSSKTPDSDKKQGGFKQNRPMDLVIAQSPSGFVFPSVFSPSGFLNSPGFFSPLQSPFGMSHQQALAHVTAQAALSQNYFNQNQNPPENKFPDEQPQPQPQIVNAKSDLSDSQIGSPDDMSVSQSDISETRHVIMAPSDTNDGYNWRKYGQKQVKASDHPRSYYKCTHANCMVKKKVGQSLDGQISDIVYKGQHNHDPPLNNKRGREGGDVSKPNNPQFENRAVEEFAPVPARDYRVNELIRIDESDDERNPKRRSMEVVNVPAVVESSANLKMVAEPKIVVQTRSEVDLLDDGFKWRKYGQKVVKGNTNPRSYYKCTYAGCNVRKHVERAPSDPKSVVTTYEGKHNHDIPVSKHRGYSTNSTVGPTGKSAPKPAQRKETKFGNNERPVLLQMKEEEITA